jgi:hypothetical protein
VVVVVDSTSVLIAPENDPFGIENFDAPGENRGRDLVHDLVADWPAQASG